MTVIKLVKKLEGERSGKCQLLILKLYRDYTAYTLPRILTDL